MEAATLAESEGKASPARIISPRLSPRVFVSVACHYFFGARRAGVSHLVCGIATLTRAHLREEGPFAEGA